MVTFPRVFRAPPITEFFLQTVVERGHNCSLALLGLARTLLVTAARKRRRMLTFMIPHCRPRGNLYSILPEYEGMFRLRDVANWASIPLIQAEERMAEDEEEEEEEDPVTSRLNRPSEPARGDP